MMEKQKKRKVPRCPLCGSAMKVDVENGIKVYRCKNYDITGCAALIKHPSNKRGW